MLINLKQAAAALGYSTSGLRKLVRQGRIQYFQSGKHGRLKFRQEWLDAFIAAGSQPEPAAVRVRRPKQPSEFGLDSRLMNL